MNRLIALCLWRLKCVPHRRGDEPFDSVVPLAFKIAASHPRSPSQAVRLACRDAFREDKTLKKIIPMIEEVLAAGGINKPKAPKESVPPAIPVPKGIGDAGHRHG